jgi:hypothetical protein
MSTSRFSYPLLFPSDGSVLITNRISNSLIFPSIAGQTVQTVGSNTTGTYVYVITTDSSGNLSLYQTTDLGQNYILCDGIITVSGEYSFQHSVFWVSENGQIILYQPSIYGYPDMFYSTDAGTSFTVIEPGEAGEIWSSVLSANGMNIYFNTSDNQIRTYTDNSLNVLFDSSDSLISYISTTYNGQWILCTDYDPLNGSGNMHVYLSSDYGSTWNTILLVSPSGYKTALTAVSWYASHIYVGLYDVSNNLIVGIVRSIDNGNTWTYFEHNGLNAYYDYINLVCSPNGQNLYLHDRINSTVYVSGNYGVSFVPYPSDYISFWLPFFAQNMIGVDFLNRVVVKTPELSLWYRISTLLLKYGV